MTYTFSCILLITERFWRLLMGIRLLTFKKPHFLSSHIICTAISPSSEFHYKITSDDWSYGPCISLFFIT